MYEVNKKPGIGFLEAVYQEAQEIELKKAEIPYGREKPLSIIYDRSNRHTGLILELFVNSSVSVRVRPWLF
jgi:GxxExxY protein